MSRLQVLAIALSVAGVAVSIYLTVLHFIGFAPACPATGPVNCEAVLSSPYAVIAGTTVPTSAAGIAWFAVSAALWLRGFANDVYAQIGAVLIIALASKNAILIVEFTRELRLAVAVLLVAVTMWQNRERVAT